MPRNLTTPPLSPSHMTHETEMCFNVSSSQRVPRRIGDAWSECARIGGKWRKKQGRDLLPHFYDLFLEMIINIISCTKTKYQYKIRRFEIILHLFFVIIHSISFHKQEII